MYHLITQRLQNLTQLNQDNNQSIRRLFATNKTVKNAVAENSLARNTFDINNTTAPSRSSNSTQMNQTDKNNRWLYAPMAAGYTGNVLASNIMEEKQAVKPVAGNLLAGNSKVGNTIARNMLMRNLSTSNSTEGNSLLAGNQTAGKHRVDIPMAGNSSTSNQPVSNTTAENSLLKDQPAGNLVAGNHLAVNLTDYNSPDGNLPAGSPWVRNSTAGNQSVRVSMARNQSVANSLVRKSQAGNLQGRNLMAENKPASNSRTGKAEAGNSHVSTYFTNTMQPGALVFSSSFNAGPTIPEDRSGIYTNLYRQPSKNVKKDIISHQTSPAYGQSMMLNYGKKSNAYKSFLTPSSDVRKTNIFTPSQYTGGYRNYQPIGIYPRTKYSGYTGYPVFTGYPGFENQHIRRGYLARPGYQVDYPRKLQPEKPDYHPATLKVYDRAPVSSNSSTIQIKLPGKPGTTNTSSLYQSFSTPDSTMVKSSGSASGSAFDEPVDMENTDDFQESQELSSSGSGDDNEDLNTNPLSDVAFMLAGTNHKPHPFSAAGLPEKLTRKQALDIFKSALYFAGLMKPEGELLTTGSMRLYNVR